MTQITIEVGDVRITVPEQTTAITVESAIRSAVASTRPTFFRAANAQVLADNMAAGLSFTKVSDRGVYLIPADAANVDHVAVIDHTTGLMWAVESLGDEDNPDDGFAHDHAVQRCKDLRLLGFDDWYLPSRAELITLIDDTRHDPAIDTDAFPRVKPRWHWTNTPAKWSEKPEGSFSAAWDVNFFLGGVGNDHRSGSGFALACRRAGQ
ncbi:Lcl C-terminal domain-containing protein [Marilutibacter alkalisoli]|uniref:DUF1566 domain-containing protein n=1 Tax=Marilutibacter alkalisoli TaxID=2591633 RepID=A0A514BV23_9GAMM|nr:DUF1566 domain-containing protein [Lysobacter alkalisoli]QDH70879.1 DUF1566 domain-containing protein [Lysobacter alkalisoli]